MEGLPKDFLTPFILLLLVLALGYVRARWRKTPIASFQEYLSYVKGQIKSAIYGFLAMFVIFLGFGLAAGAEFKTALPRSILAGMYTAVAVFSFMIWGANMLKNQKS